MDKTDKITATGITQQGREKISCDIVKELPLTIFLNGRELVTTLCSPAALDCLAVGILAAEGIIDSYDEIKKLAVDSAGGSVQVTVAEDKVTGSGCSFKPLVASGGGKGASHGAPDVVEGIDSPATLKAGEVPALVRDFLKRSDVYQQTSGVHSAALCDNKKIIVFHDDIGRHNAIDKVFGECMLKGIDITDRFIITSGRISSEILLKVARRGVPILISKSAPTNLGVALAEKLGVTIVRFMRGGGINVYSHDWRVTADDGR